MSNFVAINNNSLIGVLIGFFKVYLSIPDLILILLVSIITLCCSHFYANYWKTNRNAPNSFILVSELTPQSL